MKKRILSICMALVMCLSLLPTAAFATNEGGDTVQTATDSNGNYEINADTLAIEKVKTMIDALPDVSELEDMDNDELSEVHDKAQDAYDAFEALTEEQQAELSEELAKLRDVLDFMANLTATTAYTKTYQGYTFTLTSLLSSTNVESVDKITNVTIPPFNKSGNTVTVRMKTSGYSGTFEFSFNEDSCTNALNRNVTSTSGAGAKLKITITRGAKAHTGSATCSAAATCTTCGTSYKAAHDYGVYQNDGTNHWKACNNCTAITDKAACSGGTATCAKKAVCSTCNKEYGKIDSNNHWLSSWMYDTKNQHYRKCQRCTYTEYQSCAYNGTPNCSQTVSCSVCGNVKTAPNDHDWGEWKSNGDGTHTRTCSRNSSHTETVACSGGTATCTNKTVCATCKQAYGSLDTNNHNWSKWTSNNGTHTRTCSYGNHTESGTCSGGNATCESAAICSTCQQEYVPKKDHNYTYTANAEQHSITESCDQGCNHSATVTLYAPADLTYDGNAKEAVVTGNFKNVTTLTVTYSTDDRNAPTKVGSYTATISAGGKTVSVEFTIAKKSTTATVTVNGTYTYNGEQIKPTNVTVKDGDRNIIDAKEYTLSYGENIEAGTGTVIATFDENGSYTISGNSATGTFTIAPKPLTDAMVSVTGEFTYDGDEKSPTVTVTDGEKTLVLDTDYTLSGDETGTAAKTYTLTISGKGNYGGSVDKNWTIGDATLTGIAVEQDGTLTYDGNPKTPQVKTTVPDGLTVSFTYCSTENGTYGAMPAITNAGTHRVYYKADAANYEPYYGSFEVTIDRKEVTPTVTVAGGSIYTGKALTPAVTVKDGETTIPDSEYEVSYSGNIEVGTATVTVTDKTGGNYAITQTPKTFEIAKATMTDKNTNGSAPYGATGEVDLSSLIEQGGKLEITGTADSDSVLNGNASLDGNTLKFAFHNDAALIDKSASITVSVKDCKNYEDYKILVTVSVTDKQAPTVTVNPISKEYSGSALTDADISGDTNGVNGTWSWKEDKAPKDVADSTSNGKTWTVVFTPTDTVKYKAVEATVAVTINPCGVTISGLSVENKTYDGTTTATVSGTAVINGKIGNDDVTVQNGTAAFADKTAGTGKTVNFSGYSLTGADAGNYTLTAQPTATADITQKSVTVSGVTAVDRDYKANDRTVALSGGTVNNVETGDTVTVDLTSAIGTMENADASTNPKSVTVSGVKLTGKDAGNYVLSAQPDGVTVNISRIAYNGTTTATGSAKYGNPGEVDLSGLIQVGGTAASVSVKSDSHSALNGTPTLDGSTLKFKFKNDAALIGKEAEINVSVTGCTNYTDYTITVTVTVADKAAPTVAAPTAIANLTYNGTIQTLITAGSTTGGTLQYSLDNRIWSAELPKAKDADNYTVYYKVVGNADYADTAVNSIPVTIGKKVVTVKPKSYTITKGNAIPAFALEYVGLVDGDTLNITATPAFTCYEADGTTAVSTSTAAGSYTITWTNSDAFNFDSETNYTVTTVTTGTLTINNRPSGGGGSSSSGTTITVPISSDHATVEVKAEVSKGNATVEVSDKQIEKVAADGAGNVTLDVSDLKNVESATVPSHVVEKTNEAENTGLTVSLPAGSVTLDETALGSVTENANGKDVTISVKTVSESALTTAQKTAIGEQASVAVIVDVNIVMGTVKQSSFNGGKLTISVPYTPKAGEDTGKLTVWFIRDDGTIENKGGYYDAKNKCFVFETDHLSQYILVNTNEMQTFVDIPADAYFSNAVSWAAGKGITGGVDATHFMPNNACTRAQIVTFLWRAAGSPEPKAERSFADVPADAYYAKAVAWAVENDITGGIGNNQFAPDLTCTRAQAAAFLFRYAVANGMEAVTLQELVGGYGDASQVPSYAIPAFNWALAQGILQGYNGNLMPNNDCTRAQIVTMLYRLLGK